MSVYPLTLGNICLPLKGLTEVSLVLLEVTRDLIADVGIASKGDDLLDIELISLVLGETAKKTSISRLLLQPSAQAQSAGSL